MNLRERWSNLLARVNPSCRLVMRLHSRSLDSKPSRPDRVIMAVHLVHCPACRRAQSQISLLARTLRRYSQPVPGRAIPGLPREVRARIIAILREKMTPPSSGEPTGGD